MCNQYVAGCTSSDVFFNYKYQLVQLIIITSLIFFTCSWPLLIIVVFFHTCHLMTLASFNFAATMSWGTFLFKLSGNLFSDRRLETEEKERMPKNEKSKEKSSLLLYLKIVAVEYVVIFSSLYQLIHFRDFFPRSWRRFP